MTAELWHRVKKECYPSGDPITARSKAGGRIAVNMIAQQVVGSVPLERLVVQEVRLLWPALQRAKSGEAAEELVVACPPDPPAPARQDSERRRP